MAISTEIGSGSLRLLMFRIIQTLLNQRNLVGLQDRKRFPCGWFCGDDHVETLSDGISRGSMIVGMLHAVPLTYRALERNKSGCNASSFVNNRLNDRATRIMLPTAEAQVIMSITTIW